MSLIEIRKFAEAKMAQYNLIEAGWKFGFYSRSKGTVGLCNYREKTITLNMTYAKTEGLNASVKDTILHEIAHALTPGAGHGRVWKAMCRKIGAIPKASGGLSRMQVDTGDHLWEIRHGDKVVQKFFRKPTRMEKAIKMGTMYLKYDPAGTRGKLTLHKMVNGQPKLWAYTQEVLRRAA